MNRRKTVGLLFAICCAIPWLASAQTYSPDHFQQVTEPTIASQSQPFTLSAACTLPSPATITSCPAASYHMIVATGAGELSLQMPTSLNGATIQTFSSNDGVNLISASFTQSGSTPLAVTSTLSVAGAKYGEGLGGSQYIFVVCTVAPSSPITITPNVSPHGTLFTIKNSVPINVNGLYSSPLPSLTPGATAEIPLDQYGRLIIAPLQLTIAAGSFPNQEILVSSTITRPTSAPAYVNGDLVANSATAASVQPFAFAGASVAGSCFRVERARLTTNSTSLVNASFKILFFEASPTPTVGDGGLFESSGALSTNLAGNYAGSIAVTLTSSTSDGATGRGLPDTGYGMTLCPTTGTSAYGLLEATASYTGTAGQTFTVGLEAYRA